MTTPRTPPRFVPTLTTVLEEPAVVPEPEPSAAAASAAMPLADPSQAIALDPQQEVSEAEAFAIEEQLLHRVLQRVDLQLEERVSDAVSAAVQLHLDAMIPGLRKEIENALRALVSEAMAKELSEKNLGSTPAWRPESFS